MGLGGSSTHPRLPDGAPRSDRSKVNRTLSARPIGRNISPGAEARIFVPERTMTLLSRRAQACGRMLWIAARVPMAAPEASGPAGAGSLCRRASSGSIPRTWHAARVRWTDQAACKPGSVGPRTPRGIRDVAAIPLGRPLPTASSNQPGRLAWREGLRLPRERPRAAPIRFCSRWGLPCRPRCRVRGALLPHRFTLAAAGASPAAVCSLWHCPWGRPRRMLSGTVSPWSPDFPPRAGRGAAARPADGGDVRRGTRAVKRRRRVAGADPIPTCRDPGRASRGRNEGGTP